MTNPQRAHLLALVKLTIVQVSNAYQTQPAPNKHLAAAFKTVCKLEECAIGGPDNPKGWLIE